MRLLFFAFGLFGLIRTSDATCMSDTDCSLNGVCVDKKCECDFPWKDSDNGKEHCSILDVLPFPNDYVPAYGGPRTSTEYIYNQSVSSWGGNILLGEDGLYHLFVSRMTDGRGLKSWSSNSQIDHAIAKDPMDSFEYRDTVLSSEAHNASPLRSPNGSYLIFHIGDGNKTSSSGSGFLHHSDSPYGPWYPLQDLQCNNPAPVFDKNGTCYVACNQYGKFEVFINLDVFNGSWTHLTDLHFPDSWSGSGLRNEDPYLWIDHRNNFHLLAHRYDYRQGYPWNPDALPLPLLVSGHGYSTDMINWEFNVEQQPYVPQIHFENGTIQNFSTFERPHFIFNTSTGFPSHLVNGVSPYYNGPSGNICDVAEARPPYSNHSCVVCKTTENIDYTYTLVTKLAYE